MSNKNTVTRPSTDNKHRVFTDCDPTVLEVLNNGVFVVYEIFEDGSHKEISRTKSQYEPKSGIEENYYFLDYLSMDALRKIHLLVKTFNIEELTKQIEMLSLTIQLPSFSYQNFSMDEANVLMDTESCLDQIACFSEDSDDLNLAKEFAKFSSTYFFENSKRNITDQEKTLISDYLINVRKRILQANGY